MNLLNQSVLWALVAATGGLVGAPETQASGYATLLDTLPQRWIDDQGRPFDLTSLRGHLVVLTMAYATCHRVCPATISHLQTQQRSLDEQRLQAEFIVVGYDPETDDAAAWRQYRLTRHLTRSNWHFLIGSRASVETFAQQLGFEFWQYDRHVMHDARIVYLDKRGMLQPDLPAAEY